MIGLEPFDLSVSNGLLFAPNRPSSTAAKLAKWFEEVAAASAIESS